LKKKFSTPNSFKEDEKKSHSPPKTAKKLAFYVNSPFHHHPKVFFQEFFKLKIVIYSIRYYSSGACQCATFIWFRKKAENGFFQNIFLSINFLNTSYISSCREQNSLQEYVYNMS